jgi:hypothetical protein
MRFINYETEAAGNSLVVDAHYDIVDSPSQAEDLPQRILGGGK